MTREKIKQTKLELLVAILFSFIIFVLSSTNIGYINITSEWNLDMGIIPAVFAAMIGGYRVGVPVAIAWSVLTFINPASNLQDYTFFGLLVERITLVTVAYYAYKICKKRYYRSPANVYRAIVASVVAKNIISYIIIALLLSVEGWATLALKQFVIELALCLLAMKFLIKHLRQIHILNGVKRKEKNNKVKSVA